MKIILYVILTVVIASTEVKAQNSCPSICNNSYIFYNYGIFYNYDSYLNQGTFYNHNTFHNYGSFNNEGTYLNYRTFNNESTFNNEADFYNEADFHNQGTFYNDYPFNNYGTFKNEGTFNNDYTFYNHGSFENIDTITDLGDFVGFGEFINRGLLSPGNSPGIINIDGSLTFSSPQSTDFPKYLAELSTNSNDVINVGGAVTFSGELEVLLIDGKVPLMGESFTLMSYSSRTGTFTNVNLPAGYDWSLDYGSSELTLTMNTLLPVELFSFEGKAIGDDIHLNWITSIEANNDYFSIERSGDGNEFVTIGRVEGRGTTNKEVIYDFIDRSSISGENYYRLKQVDNNGDYDYSKIISVNKAGSRIIWYENPVLDGMLNIHLDAELSDELNYILYDMAGNIIKQEKLSNWQSEINVRDLKGIFLLRLESPKTNIIQKVIISK
ncbi:T9SS type A sorting domain-containing protein [Portibacter lacus]|nr:T9SS type A sorting domain-containing protein [Portibacter lacus]